MDSLAWRKSRRHSPVRPNGFTLIEVLLAIAIFAVIIASLFSSYTGSLRIMKAAEPQADLYRKARVTLNRISDDLESAYYLAGKENRQEPDNLLRFEGTNEMVDLMDADTLSFISRAHISFDDDRVVVGVTVVSYYVAEADAGLVLFRSDTPAYSAQPDENTGGLVLCDGLAGINFTYFDAAGEPYDSWSISDEARDGKIPSRVAIQIWLKGESQQAPVTFSTAVALPINDR